MRRRKSAIFFLVLGICLIALAIALNVGWILLNLQQIALLIFGIIFFALIITGLILNMIFLIREIRKNEQQDAFLNAVTHELKTPIASIKLYLETLKTREVAEEKRVEFYDVMLADSDRLLTTVEQVLQASQMREKKRSLSAEEVDIEAALRGSIDVARTQNHLDETAIEFSGTGEKIFVSADESEIKTVFANLLNNAIKYSEEDVKIFVNVKLLPSNFVEISFKDNGIGLLPEDLKKIFRKFYRVERGKTQRVRGSGLGLYIVSEILKKHGGKIFAESKGLSKGTLFVLRLPVVP